MSRNLGFLEDESLTNNLADGLAKKFLEWLEYLALIESPDLDRMLQFTKGFNKAKVVPLSHKGKYLNNLFEIVLFYSTAESKQIIIFADHLTEKGAIHVTKRDQEKEQG